MRVSEDVFWVSGMLVSVYGCLWKCLGYVRGDMGVSGDVQWCLGVSGGVGRCWGGPKGGVWQSFPLNFLQFQKVTNDILDIFQWTLRSQMSQISKCPKLRVVLGYWEALGEVSEMRYNNLLYSSSKRSYCSSSGWLKANFLFGTENRDFYFLTCNVQTNLRSLYWTTIFIGPESDHWQCLSLTD